MTVPHVAKYGVFGSEVQSMRVACMQRCAVTEVVAFRLWQSSHRIFIPKEYRFCTHHTIQHANWIREYGCVEVNGESDSFVVCTRAHKSLAAVLVILFGARRERQATKCKLERRGAQRHSGKGVEGMARRGKWEADRKRETETKTLGYSLHYHNSIIPCSAAFLCKTTKLGSP